MNKGYKCFLICVEGNIASGKTTLLEQMANNNTIVVFEPIQKMLPFLDKIRSDPKKHMFAFQKFMFKHFADIKNLIAQHDNKNTIILTERSAESCLQFCYQGFEQGCITKQQMVELTKLYDEGRLCYDLRIYLDTDSQTCFSRKMNRQRKEEQHLSLTDLKNLESRFKTMFQRLGGFKQTINGNNDKQTVFEQTQLAVAKFGSLL